ncbi:hypothetical protein KI387_030568, partial [Taxus chinensis]
RETLGGRTACGLGEKNVRKVASFFAARLALVPLFLFAFHGRFGSCSRLELWGGV